MCHRCGAAFTGASGLEEHQRAESPCMLRRVLEPVDEMDAATEARVRRKRRLGARVSEADKWREMYCVLFGEGVDVPSPCKLFALSMVLICHLVLLRKRIRCRSGEVRLANA